MLKKRAKIVIDNEFLKAVEKLKEIITNEPTIPYHNKIERPVAYASRTLSDTETKYSTTEK